MEVIRYDSIKILIRKFQLFLIVFTLNTSLRLYCILVRKKGQLVYLEVIKKRIQNHHN